MLQWLNVARAQSLAFINVFINYLKYIIMIYNINKAYDMQHRIEHENGRMVVEYDKKHETKNEIHAKMVLHFMEIVRLNLSEFTDVSQPCGLDRFVLEIALVLADNVVYIGKNCD